MKKTIRKLSVFLFSVCVLYFIVISYFYFIVPESFYAHENTEITLNNLPLPTAISRKTSKSAVSASRATADSTNYDIDIKLLGIFPIKSASVKVVESKNVDVCGNPFGIKMFTEGVVVVSTVNIETASGNRSPASEAGIKAGDTILSMNGKAVCTNEDVAAIINNCGGATVVTRLKRKNMEFEVSLTPLKSKSDGGYKSGMWVRDSSAGIGTLTFFDKETLSFGGLGHAICDVDTGEILPLRTGEIVLAEILSVQKGYSGSPGELRGKLQKETIGALKSNGETGVFGTLQGEIGSYQNMPIAYKQDIQNGDAYILTTINGTTPKPYKAKVEKVNMNDKSLTKNMIIKVVDEELIEKSGGIVQGMSGSPIIQNGKLIGAVTHVFVNDSQKGYGIFIENMLETAQGVAESNKLKDAS